MARRRKKNPLLMRIIVISIAVHAIALPIAAHFGAFQKIQKQFGSSNVVVINTPPIEEKKSVEKEKPKPKPQPRQEAKRSSAESKHAGSAPKSNLSQPKVLSGAADGAAGSGPTVDPNGTGKAGALPTDLSKGTAPSGNGTNTTTTPPSSQPPEPKPPEPPPKPPEPPPLPPKPPAPAEKAKKFVQVETTYAPDPVIPDDLRSEPLDKTTVVEADVSKDGLPENVTVAQSSGNKELDDIGLATAKKYRFKAATLGDDPVEGHVRFRIIFKVE